MPILASETYVVHYWLTSRRFLLAWVAGYQDRLYDGWLVGVVPVIPSEEEVLRRKLMSDTTMELAQRGFAAWQQGDFATIEALLDSAVEWRWFEPGEWDCHGRQDVMDVIRERYEQGFARGELEFVDGGQDSVIVVAHPAAIGGEEWPAETATVITFRESKIVDMQDYRTKDEALTAIT